MPHTIRNAIKAAIFEAEEKEEKGLLFPTKDTDTSKNCCETIYLIANHYAQNVEDRTYDEALGEITDVLRIAHSGF